MASDRAVAEALSRFGAKVSPYEVRQWRNRMQEEPREEFDGTDFDYFLKISDPAMYERLQSRREQGEE